MDSILLFSVPDFLKSGEGFISYIFENTTALYAIFMLFLYLILRAIVWQTWQVKEGKVAILLLPILALLFIFDGIYTIGFLFLIVFIFAIVIIYYKRKAINDEVETV